MFPEFCFFAGFGRLDNDATSNMGIYNGNEFVFKTSGYSFIDKIKLFLRYGMGLLKLNRFTSGTLENFIKVYALQDEGRSFETVSDLLNTLGGDYFIQLTKKSARKMLLDNGVPKQIIDELATAVTRCNYGQDMGVNAFTGMLIRFQKGPNSTPTPSFTILLFFIAPLHRVLISENVLPSLVLKRVS